MTRRPGRRSRLGRAFAVALFVTCAAACQEGGIVVRGLAFDGNEAFSDARLAEVVVTRASGWLPWSRRHVFDQSVFEADLERLRAFYADRGYPDARVTAASVDLDDENTTVRLRIGIAEGAPLLVERIDIVGLDVVDVALGAELRAGTIAPGAVRDRQLIAADRERLAFLLRDRGYPQPHVEVSEAAGSTAGRVVLTYEVTPGPAANFGETSIVGLQSVNERIVRRTLAFAPGQLFRQSEVLESQRRLSALGLFSFAHVAPRPDEAPEGGVAPPAPRGNVVPMRVAVAEAKPTQLKIGIGYGSEDGPRGSLEWRHLNFMHAARRLSANMRYSARLRGLDTDFTEPYFFSPALSLRGQVFGWWQNEPTYTARSFGGRASVAYKWEAGRGFRLQPIEHVVRLAYINESQRYQINPETLVDLTHFDELIALGFDPVTGQGSGRVGAIGLDAERVEVDRPLDPRTGYTLRAHVQYATPALGGTFRYTEVEAESRAYVPIGSAVLAGRVRAGTLNARTASDVPFSARYYLGGSSSLRGWGRIQVAPLTPDGLPIGGLSVLELSSELRVPVKGAIGAVLFVDAGNVWAESSNIRVDALRVDVGPGLRYASPFGVVRADFGYQLTPIDGLLVAGKPEGRQWRIHFSIGHAF